MKNQSGKSPLGWIITIAVSLVIAGVMVAMIFAGNEDISNQVKQYQEKNQKDTVQTQK